DRAPAFNPPIIKGGTIYLGSADGNFYALDIRSGYMRWVFRTGGVINSVPFANERHVYFGSNDGKVYALSLEDGEPAWEFQTESTVQSTVVRHGDSVIFTSDGGSTYFLSPQGVEEHRLANPVWHRDSFQVHDDVLYFAPGPLNRPHSLGAYDLREGTYLWLLDTASMGASWYSFPALRRNAVHLATCAGRSGHWELTYYAYDRRTGELIWKHREESSFGEGSVSAAGLAALYRRNLKLLDYLAPSLWRNLVVYTSGDAVVRAFRAQDGKPVWRRVFDSPTSSAPTVAGDRVYFGLHGEVEGMTRGGSAPGASAPRGEGSIRNGGSGTGGLESAAPRKPRLVCLSVRDGEKLWEMELEGALLSAPVIAGKWLVFGTDRNLFYVLEELY
ncbi:MAG: PQQ-binding-like beta-propeller repeat protein, partial [Spirochaetota bacterium]